jgi:hypothetical protein
MIGLDMQPLGMADLIELTRPKPAGVAVNSHVVYVPKEPMPDFARMQELTTHKPRPSSDREQTAPETNDER